MPDDPLLFTPDVLERIERESAWLPERFRSALWRSAIQPEFGAFRAWLDGELREFDAIVRTSFLSRLRDEQLFTQALAEIAAGYALRLPGHSVEFGPVFGQLTPDLLVTDPNGHQLIVEVWRRCLPRTVVSRNKQWGLLARQIQRIPSALAVAVDSTSHEVVEPPDESLRRELVPRIRHWWD